MYTTYNVLVQFPVNPFMDRGYEGSGIKHLVVEHEFSNQKDAMDLYEDVVKRYPDARVSLIEEEIHRETVLNHFLTESLRAVGVTVK